MTLFNSFDDLYESLSFVCTWEDTDESERQAHHSLRALTPLICSSSENAVELGPQFFAHFAMSQSILN